MPKLPTRYVMPAYDMNGTCDFLMVTNVMPTEFGKKLLKRKMLKF